eukprot:217574_1
MDDNLPHHLKKKEVDDVKHDLKDDVQENELKNNEMVKYKVMVGFDTTILNRVNRVNSNFDDNKFIDITFGRSQRSFGTKITNELRNVLQEIRKDEDSKENNIIILWKR